MTQFGSFLNTSTMVRMGLATSQKPGCRTAVADDQQQLVSRKDAENFHALRTGKWISMFKKAYDG